MSKNNNVKTKKVTKQSKVKANEIKASLCVPEYPNENIGDEIICVLEDTKFNKISIPINTYRYIVDGRNEIDDVRLCTVGYIRDYNANNKEFTVVIFDRFVGLINKPDTENIIKLAFTTNKDGSLRTITKFIITSLTYTKENEFTDEEDM